MIRYHSIFFVRVGPETMYAAEEKHHFFTIFTMSSSDLPRLLRTTVCSQYRDSIAWLQSWFHAQLALKILNGIY